jgi:hypothetical protein
MLFYGELANPPNGWNRGLHDGSSKEKTILGTKKKRRLSSACLCSRTLHGAQRPQHRRLPRLSLSRVVRLDSDESLNRHPQALPVSDGSRHTADFLTFKPKQRFDICLCLQVLEHIPDARAFAQKLLASSPRVLISVPYLWAADSHVQHVHDPIDEAKVVAWFGQSPSFSMISTEHRTGVRRLICYFEELGWKRRLEKILSHQR